MQVESGHELPSGSSEELEIRAASVLAVEQLKQAANKLLSAQHQGHQQGSTAAFQLLSVQLDWWLWQEGERRRSQDAHHKTWTIYY
jgi:hypothetical protein